MKPISKIKITGLALGVAAFLASNVLAVPQSKQYPEYQPVEGGTPLFRGAEKPPPVTPDRSATVVTPPEPVAPPPAKAVPVVRDEPAPVAPVTTVAATELGRVFDSNLITVEKIPLKDTGDTGADVQYIVRVTAKTNVKEVRITEHLPEGVTFVGASPDVAKSDNDLNWGWDSMSRGEVKDTVITLRPNQDGTFLTATKVCVDPAVQYAFVAGTPRLEVSKTGPPEADLNTTITYNVIVRNVGTAVARNVVLVDNLPAGLKGATTSFDLGDLRPGDTKTVSVPVTVVAEGDWVNTVTTNASNVAAVTSQAPLSVIAGKLSVSKTGPANMTITRDATYNIAVKNVGSSKVDNITVTDDLPKGVRLVDASDSPVTQNNNQVVWTIASLAPEEVATRTVTFTASEPMTTTNRATARSAKGVTDTASATTIWDGPPGILTEIIDSVDPIRVGDPVVYTVRVTNQGAFKEINAKIKVLFSDEVTPVSSSDGSATIDGKVVTLPDLNIKPRGAFTFTIQAKGVQEGIATTRLEVDSSFLAKPIIKDETTVVY